MKILVPPPGGPKFTKIFINFGPGGDQNLQTSKMYFYNIIKPINIEKIFYRQNKNYERLK